MSLQIFLENQTISNSPLGTKIRISSMKSKCFRFLVTRINFFTHAVAAIRESDLCKGLFAYFPISSEAFKAIIGSILTTRIVLRRFEPALLLRYDYNQIKAPSS